MTIDIKQFKKLHAAAVAKYRFVRGLNSNTTNATEDQIDEFFFALQEFSEYIDQVRGNLTTNDSVIAFNEYLDRWPLYGLIDSIIERVGAGKYFDIEDEDDLLLKALDRLFYVTTDDHNFGSS
jgi:hypothetical protein